jgi:hypothetical protein
MRAHARFSLVLALAATLGCGASQYVYEPATTTYADIAGRPAADTRVLDSEVRASALGVTGLPGRRALHVRFAIANRSGERRLFETAAAAVELGEGARRRIAGTDESGGRPASVEVPAGTTRVIDVFFPLPEGANSAGGLSSSFDVWWSLAGETVTATERTRFARVE